MSWFTGRGAGYNLAPIFTGQSRGYIAPLLLPRAVLSTIPRPSSFSWYSEFGLLDRFPIEAHRDFGHQEAARDAH